MSQSIQAGTSPAATNTTLECGRDIDQLWGAMSDRPTAHEVSCPFCSAARDDLRPLAEASTSLRAQEQRDAESADSTVVETILAIARAEVRRGRRLPLDRPDTPSHEGLAMISEQALSSLVREVGDADPRLEVRRCTVRLTDLPPDEQTTDEEATAEQDAADASPDGDVREPSTVRVTLRLSAALGTDLLGTVAELRSAIRTRIRADVGVEVTTIDITVEDLHDQ